MNVHQERDWNIHAMETHPDVEMTEELFNALIWDILQNKLLSWGENTKIKQKGKDASSTFPFM